MKIYDITVPITPGMTTWPGDPRVILDRYSKIGEGADVNITKVTMSVHTGTHVDAPVHFIVGGKGVDEIPIQTMIGRVYVIDLPDDEMVTAEVLKRADIPPRTRRVLFKTRNSEFWARGETTFQANFVALSEDAATYLVKRGVKLVGVDYLSVAPYHQSRPTHEILLRAGVIIVEGLNLSGVSRGRYTLYCLPLKLAGLDGAPARAILVGV